MTQTNTWPAPRSLRIPSQHRLSAGQPVRPVDHRGVSYHEQLQQYYCNAVLLLYEPRELRKVRETTALCLTVDNIYIYTLVYVYVPPLLLAGI